MKNVFRGFHWLSKKYYGIDYLKRTDYIDEITFGLYFQDNGTIGEIVVRWYNIDGIYTPKMSIYSDAWKVLSTCKDLIDYLAQYDGEDPTPEEFSNYLIECGFIDISNDDRF